MVAFIASVTARASRTSDGNLTEIMRNHNLPAVAASYDDGVSGFKQAQVGVHKVGTAIAATSSDLWHLGSNTKAMVAMAIGLLIQDELLSWDTQLQKVFNKNGTGITLSKGSGEITIAHLSSHTAGLSDKALFDDTEMSARMYGVDAATGRLLYSNISLSRPPTHRQGVYEYANIDYVILGLIIDVIAGVPAEAHIQSRLFEPLNMTSAGWGPLPEAFTTSAEQPYPHSANGTLGLGGPPIPYPVDQSYSFRDYPPALHTAGMAHMTMQDYNKWLRLHVDEDLQVAVNVSKQTLAMLHRPHPETNMSSEGYGYTYGAWIRVDSDTDSGHLIVHDGSNLLNYFTAAVDIVHNVTVAVATNVGGMIVDGAAWIEGVHLARDGLLTRDLNIAG